MCIIDSLVYSIRVTGFITSSWYSYIGNTCSNMSGRLGSVRLVSAALKFKYKVSSSTCDPAHSSRPHGASAEVRGLQLYVAQKGVDI
jgi:hypothetical protein